MTIIPKVAEWSQRFGATVNEFYKNIIKAVTPDKAKEDLKKLPAEFGLMDLNLNKKTINMNKVIDEVMALRKLEHSTNRADVEWKRITGNLLMIGSQSKTRAHYKDGTQAETESYNGEMSQYDLTKGQLPLITLRPIATRLAFNEMLWIYQDASNDLNLAHDKYGINWWDEWDIGDGTIGACYGEVVRRHNLMNRLLTGLITDPDGRRHVMSLWQDDVFESDEKYGLPPCCFLTMWNVRHASNGTDYLDMSLIQRSSDYCVSGCINEIQYVGLQYIVARHCGLMPGKFTHFMQNVHVYTRHMGAMVEMSKRETVKCAPKIWLNPDKTNFYDFTPDDIKVIDYPINQIKAQNPQITVFRDEIAI